MLALGSGPITTSAIGSLHGAASSTHFLTCRAGWPGSRGHSGRLAIIDPRVVVPDANLARPGKNIGSGVHEYRRQHLASGDLDCPVHIRGDDQHTALRSSTADVDGSAGGPARDMDATATSGAKFGDRNALAGGDREREAVVGIRHASECATVPAHRQSA